MGTVFSASWWKTSAINAFVYGIVAVTILVIVSLIAAPFLQRPPVKLTSLQPEYLGNFCPGDRVWIRYKAEIGRPAIIIYYVTVMDPGRLQNVIGTQKAWTDIQHPVAGIFENQLEWVVPDLTAGDYARSFAARGMDGDEKTTFIYGLPGQPHDFRL